MQISVTINDAGLKRASKKIEGLPDKLGEATFSYAKVAANSIKKQFIIQGTGKPRQKTGSRIKAKKLSKKESVIVLPTSAWFIETMRPHYVSLKKGRNVTRWARSYFGDQTKSGLSNVRRGKRGGIYGSLYVMSDPFVEKGMKKVEKRLSEIMSKVTKEALR